MAKKNTAKSPNKDSIRSKRRAKRGFTMSRPNRRAAKRLASASKNIDPTDTSARKPGAINHW